MNYNKAIDYLYGLQKYGIKLGLDNTIRLLSLLRNPQESFKAIHVAGTNGKGSTSVMIASVLRAAGFRTGLFTSPHLVSFTERIKVDDEEIKEAEVIELTDEIKEIINSSQCSEFNPTFFEFVTAMAFLYFRRKGIEWAVIETGMGGRLDATNILLPEVSVITNISLDHKEFLGQTLKEVAAEKAGIIKHGIPVVSSSQDTGAMDVIKDKVSSEGIVLHEYGRDFVSLLRGSDIRGITFDYKGKNSLDGLYVPLCGMHQMENASAAIKAIELIMERESIYPESIRQGLANTEWHGRLELIRKPGKKYDILIDGAHNPSAAGRLSEALKSYFAPQYNRIILIFGIMSDKDIKGIMEPLLPIASEIIVTAPDYGRSASPEKLAETARSLGFKPVVVNSVKDALDTAVRRAENSSVADSHLIVITGSFYTIGEAKTILGQKGVLTRLRE